MIQTLTTIWLLGCLAVIAYIDFRQQIIPDLCLLLMLPAAFVHPEAFTHPMPAALALSADAWAIGAAACADNSEDFRQSIVIQNIFCLPARANILAAMIPIALYILMAVIAAAFRQDVPVGMGDAKLLAVIALISGPPALLFTATFGSLLGGAAAATLLILKKATKKSRIAFGPFLAAAYAAYLLL